MLFRSDRDKKTSAGAKFADMELIGIPHRLVVSDRGLEHDQIEYKARNQAEPLMLPLQEVVNRLKSMVNG